MDFDPDTHPVRITTSGKIKTWVQHALDFLEVRCFLSGCFSCSFLVGERRTFVDLSHSTSSWNPPRRQGIHRHHTPPHHCGRNSQTRTFGTTQGEKELLPCWCTPIQRGRCLPRSGFATRAPAGCNGIGLRVKVCPLPRFSSGCFTNHLRSVSIKKTVYMKVTLSRKKLQHLVDRGAT